MLSDQLRKLIENNFRYVLDPVVGVKERVVALRRTQLPVQRARGDGFRRIPGEIVVVGSCSCRVKVADLEISVVEKPLIVLLAATTHVIIAHRQRRIVGIAHPANRAVFTVVGDSPETGLRRDQGLVAVIVVSERFGRLSDVELVGCSGNKVFALIAVRGGFGERCVGFEIGETAGGGVVEEVAAEIIGAEAEGRVLVDRDSRIEIGFTAHRRVTGGGTGSILVQVVRLVGRGLRFALLVVGRRRTTVANRVVVEVFGEAGDGLAVFRAAGRSQLRARVVGVAVDGARKIAEGGAALGDGYTATGGIVGVVEL